MPVNKEQFIKEHQKWRQFKRALNNSYHGQGDGYLKLEISEATKMMWNIYYDNCPIAVKYAIDNKEGGNSQAFYRELSSELGRSMFHVHVLLNMELPSSFVRILEK